VFVSCVCCVVLCVVCCLLVGVLLLFVMLLYCFAMRSAFLYIGRASVRGLRPAARQASAHYACDYDGSVFEERPSSLTDNASRQNTGDPRTC